MASREKEETTTYKNENVFSRSWLDVAVLQKKKRKRSANGQDDAGKGHVSIIYG